MLPIADPGLSARPYQLTRKPDVEGMKAGELLADRVPRRAVENRASVQ
jgi:hypothetical protein